jgi:hypothetical protein
MSGDIGDVGGESEILDFKSKFDPSSKQDWCELIKDIVAMTNSGGGRIVFGVNDDGSPSNADLDPIASVDPADLTNKVHSYTEQQFPDHSVSKGILKGANVVVMEIGLSRIPMVFTSPGTYPTGSGTQKTAFAKGTVYFRHGAKSEPATSEDIRASIERELTRVKDFWLQGIGKVVTAPPGTVVQVVQQDVSLKDTPESAPIRLTNDANAPAFRAIQADRLYPYRQKELINKINERIGRKVIGPFEVLAIRYAHNVDANPTFSYKSQWSPRQYSDAFAAWLIEAYEADNEFFVRAKESLKRKYRGDD